MKIGPFEIIETLGGGGSGIVYRARHDTLGRIVAVKQLNRQVQEGDRTFERFKREAQIMASIHSDYVVTLYSYQVLDGRPLLEMECLDTGSLEDLMNAGPIELGTALAIVRDILLGLKALHGAGIVHRDIKPANVLQDNNEGGRFKLTDFGLSVLESETKPTLEAATIRYVAPESISENPTCDFRSDLYSVGMVLYEALLGAGGFHDAFPDLTPAAAFGAKWLAWLKDRTKEATPLHVLRPEIPVPVSQLAARLMAKDPDLRYGSADAALTALQPLREMHPAGQMPRPEPRKVQPPAPAPVPVIPPIPPGDVHRPTPAPPTPTPMPSGMQGTSGATRPTPPAPTPRKRSNALLYTGGVIGMLVLCVVAIALGAWLRRSPTTPNPKRTVQQQPVVSEDAAGTLAARIVDEAGATLVGAKLTIVPGNVHGVSDDTGTFVFEKLSAGRYEISASADGRQTAVRQVAIQSGQRSEETLTLPPAGASSGPTGSPGTNTLRTGLPTPNYNARAGTTGLVGRDTNTAPPGPSGNRVAGTPNGAGGTPGGNGAGKSSEPAPKTGAPPKGGGGATSVGSATSADLSRALATRLAEVMKQRGMKNSGAVRVSLEMSTRPSPFVGRGITADYVATVRTAKGVTKRFEGNVLAFAEVTLRNDVLDRAAADIATYLGSLQ